MKNTFRLSTICFLLILSLIINIPTAYTKPGELPRVHGQPQFAEIVYPGLTTRRSELPPGVTPEWWEAIMDDLHAPDAPDEGDFPTPLIDWTRDGYINNGRGGRFGYAVSSAGDVNNDGYDDVIVGAPSYFYNYTNQGSAYVYLGSESGLSTDFVWSYYDQDWDGYAQFGMSASSAGDFNCDGYDDVIVGAYQYKGTYTSQGYAMVFYGKSAATGSLNASPGWTVYGSAAWERYGSAVATAGDVNGDTCDDIIVGAMGWYNDPGTLYEGAAFVYHGGASPDTTYEWMVQGDQYDTGLGKLVDTAGDVNNDGYDDIILGLPFYDTGGRIWVYHGSANGLSNGAVTGAPTWSIVAAPKSISAAGDVNGDGYDDILYGDQNYTAYAYYGSSGGLSTTSNWSTHCGLSSEDYWSGFWVSEGGDVNNDGYDDVLVSAPTYPYEQIAGPGQYKSEGYVYFFYGSAGGLHDTPTWSMKGNQVEAILGEWEALGAAGDVNNDGYDDLIIGSPGINIDDVIGVGRAYAVYGEPDSPITGLAVENDSPKEINQTVNFTATITTGSYVGYDWDFGDGVTASNAGSQVAHIYAAVGTYTATVIADNIVNTQTATTIVTVTDTPITSLTASNDSPTALGDPTALSADISAGTNVSYTWSLGDGNVMAGKDVLHTYGTTGVFTAVVTATNSIDQQVATTMVSIEEPVSGLSASNDSPTALGEPTGLSSDIAAGTNVTYTWKLGDGVIKYGEDIFHIYGESGVFTAVVTASNAINQQVASTMVYIEEALTGLNAGNDSPTALGEPTAFSASISTGTNVTYTWNLGDGQVKFGKDVIHTYSEAGEYSAVVTATNPVDQQVASTMVTIEVPISGLTAVNDSPTIVGNLTTLTATITGGTNVSYFWAFSNGGTSTGQVAAHLFDMVGIHSATVTATNNLGSQIAVTKIMIGEAVTLLEGTETYTTSDGTLNLQLPAPLTETITITYTPQTMPSHTAGGFMFAGQSFQLSMMDENGDPIIELEQPITLTVYYDESKLPVGTDEDQLSLQRYDTPTSSWVVLPVITRDTAADLLAVSLDHLSEFTLFLEAQHRIYLPLINR